MKFIYNNKEIELINCKSFYTRLMGNMFKKNISKALLFERCNSIHTFFMYDKIDVIMCDKDDYIKVIFKGLNKNKIILPQKGTVKTLEFPEGYYDFKINDKIRMVN